jgi:hypothetical protein
MQAQQLRKDYPKARTAASTTPAARSIPVGRVLAFAMVLAIVLLAGALIVRSLPQSQSGSTTISISQQAPDAAERNAAAAAELAGVERWQGLAGAQGGVLQEQTPDAKDRNAQVAGNDGVGPIDGVGPTE